MKRGLIIEIIAAAIALMFFYAAFSKLIDFEKSRHEMMNQVFPGYIAKLLVWLVPITELLLTAGLLIDKTRLKALYASLLLLIAFSLYISMSMTGIFGRIPCSCGGILKHMGYGTHLLFNLFFISISIIAIFLEKRNIYFIKKGGLSKSE